MPVEPVDADGVLRRCVHYFTRFRIQKLLSFIPMKREVETIVENQTALTSERLKFKGAFLQKERVVNGRVKLDQRAAQNVATLKVA